MVFTLTHISTATDGGGLHSSEFFGTKNSSFTTVHGRTVVNSATDGRDSKQIGDWKNK